MTDKCPCDKQPTMLNIISSCPQTKQYGGPPRLHLADNVDVQWMMEHGQ